MGVGWGEDSADIAPGLGPFLPSLVPAVSGPHGAPFVLALPLENCVWLLTPPDSGAVSRGWREMPGGPEHRFPGVHA